MDSRGEELIATVLGVVKRTGREYRSRLQSQSRLRTGGCKVQEGPKTQQTGGEEEKSREVARVKKGKRSRRKRNQRKGGG